MFDKMSDLITNMTHFDEKLKLKLQLNLELTEQDQKVWEKHLEILRALNKEHLAPGEGDSEGKSMEDTIETLQELVYKLATEEHFDKLKISHRQDFLDGLGSGSQEEDLEATREKHSLQNEELKRVMDCLRTMMQRQSITWSML